MWRGVGHPSYRPKVEEPPEWRRRLLEEVTREVPQTGSVLPLNVVVESLDETEPTARSSRAACSRGYDARADAVASGRRVCVRSIASIWDFSSMESTA